VELVCLGVGLLALFFALGLTPLVRQVALRVGFLDQPGPRKLHVKPMPYGGGVAVVVALALAVGIAAWVLAGLLHSQDGTALRQELELTPLAFDASVLRLLRLCLLGALGALALGIVDDRYTLTPLAKLVVQFILAGAVVWGGVRLTVLIGDNLVTQAITVLWIVLLTNSFNLLDNMDGLCAGTVAISAGLLALVAGQTSQGAVAVVASALAGAGLGFLKWNFSPATIYLGDAGAMFCGFLMATLCVVTTYYHYRESPLSIGVPFLILAIPLYDTASVLILRLRSGRPLLKGDRSHFSHRLVDLGMSHRQAVATIHLAALAIGLPAVVIRRLTTSEGLVLVGQSLLVLAVIALLERAGHLRSERGGGHD
jgi:UDP-GlcNAc:undecaprenyl-phosphate/decaprenyl-phosphate GlcNAc-1-phosphate transferase